MGYADNIKQTAKEHSIGAEGYFRPEIGTHYFVADCTQAPFFREQEWPDGAQLPNLYRFGSGRAAAHVEIRGWVHRGGQMVPVVLDGELRKFAKILEIAENGRVIQITRTDGPHPKNKAWRLATYAFALTEHAVDTAQLPALWAAPKGLTQAQLDAAPSTPQASTPPGFAPSFPAPSTPPAFGGGFPSIPAPSTPPAFPGVPGGFPAPSTPPQGFATPSTPPAFPGVPGGFPVPGGKLPPF